MSKSQDSQNKYIDFSSVDQAGDATSMSLTPKGVDKFKDHNISAALMDIFLDQYHEIQGNAEYDELFDLMLEGDIDTVIAKINYHKNSENDLQKSIYEDITSIQTKEIKMINNEIKSNFNADVIEQAIEVIENSNKFQDFKEQIKKISKVYDLNREVFVNNSFERTGHLDNLGLNHKVMKIMKADYDSQVKKTDLTAHQLIIEMDGVNKKLNIYLGNKSFNTFTLDLNTDLGAAIGYTILNTYSKEGIQSKNLVERKIEIIIDGVMIDQETQISIAPSRRHVRTASELLEVCSVFGLTSSQCKNVYNKYFKNNKGNLQISMIANPNTGLEIELQDSDGGHVTYLEIIIQKQKIQDTLEEFADKNPNVTIIKSNNGSPAHITKDSVGDAFDQDIEF